MTAVSMYLQDGDLLLDQVWLLLDHRDDLMNGFGDRDRDVLDDRNNVRLGYPDWNRDWVRLWDGNRFRDMNHVRLGNLLQERQGIEYVCC